MPQERVGQPVGRADAVDAALGGGDDVVEGVGGEVGQLHPLQVGPQRLSRFATVRGSLAKRV